MSIDYDTLMKWPIPVIQQDLTWQECARYALGCGVGIVDPKSADELRYVYEPNMIALPMMAVVLATPGFWLKDPATGIDWRKVLHGEQMLTIHSPIPIQGRLRGVTVVEEIYDKGPGRGAVLYQRREVHDIDCGIHLATVRQSNFLRGEGGFGGPTAGSPQAQPMPESRPYDGALALPTRPEQALLYRLSGDYNPLHIDPNVARAAGFSRPILHGLCTFGVVGRALVRLICENDASRLRQMEARFTAPAYPGETIQTEVWKEQGGDWVFRARVLERDLLILNHGYARVA